MRVKIRYIDGPRLKTSVIASAARISEMQEILNNINVFPVADADTGTNMVMTMRSIVESAQACPYNTLTGICTCIADGALTGARGNSGAILAQFFHGLSEGAKGKDRLSPKEFAQAVSFAVRRAREALSNPKEGTILTVMQDWADYLKEQAIGENDFVQLFRDSLKRARESLAETPKKLLVLRKAGVVDAGAQGFVHLLEGLSEFIDSGKVAAFRAKTHVVEKIRHFHFHKANDEIKYQFCTECLIQGTDLNRSHIQSELNQMGDSLIVVGSNRKIRIHIHTNDPEKVFSISSSFGSIEQKKAEDMRKQNKEAISNAPRHPIGLVTDSTCDIPQELIRQYQIHVVPVMVQIGDKSYQDRIDISTFDFYQILKNDTQRLTTSQPPTASFISLYKKLSERYEAIISLHISEALSGTVNGARSAAKEISDKLRCEVLNTKTTSAGLGLVVAEAAKLIENGASLDDIVAKIKQDINQVRIFVSVPTLKYLIRSGRMHKSKGLLGTFLQVKPVISLNSEGRAVEIAKVIGRKRVEEKTLEMALQYGRQLINPRFSVVHVLNPDLAEFYRKSIMTHFSVDSVPILDTSPALGLHTGIGSAAIAVLGNPVLK